MKINYMFSRIDRDKGFNDNQKKYIKEDIKNDMSITFIASLFDSMVNIVAVIPVYNTYGILNLVTKGILTIPLINSTLSVLLYNLFKTSILKLKED